MLKPPEYEYTHPYTYITENYDKTFNAKQTGLPGYTPPFLIRIINTFAYLTKYIHFFVVLLNIIVIASSLLFATLNYLTSLSMSYTGPFAGVSLLTVPKVEFTLFFTPVIVTISLYIGSVLFMFGFESLSYLLSKPYEDEYEEWLQKLEPINTAYPPSVQYTLSENESYSDLKKTAPTSAPQPFTDPQLYDKVISALATFVFIQTWQFAHMFGSETPWFK
jgi:hypothetical protein